ncbi:MULTISPECIES: hypothetical protein [Alteribacter]|uniref:Uncharacterized protein n=1 Tax=Alteribacter keqinensis TaxID=2483800 RepID=A0A3M7TWX6_9BACI|nr:MULTISPECIES: hypothetical protein [Alteribacter]MBM7097669.1 hypothetical protein [Alteribacter salitolerans]RNA70117.1 hypothetical protein EBO34_09370 [Alteribacter keqinensis]
MSRCAHYYNVCSRNQGRNVRIIEHSGRQHAGRIVRVTPSTVYIEGRGPRGGFGGFGYGYYGSYGYRPYVYPVALAAISGFALGALLFW